MKTLMRHKMASCTTFPEEPFMGRGDALKKMKTWERGRLARMG